jgi:hypothetical protein
VSKFLFEIYVGIYYKLAFRFVKQKMANQGICDNCGLKDGCKQVYQRMADYQGPSVLGKVLIAFVLPLLSFVLAVAVFGKVAGRFGLVRELEVILSLVFGLFTAAGVVLVVKVISRQFRKDRQA